MIRVEVNNEIVDSYWIRKYESGITHLLINTTDRWVNYHRFSNDEYGIGETRSDAMVYDFHLYIHEIPEISGCICTSLQEKDQISFYWIPIELVSAGKIKTHYETSRHENNNSNSRP